MNNGCFAAGTKVLTDEGEKDIEDIRAGDRVLAEDAGTGEQEYREVLETYIHEVNIIVHVRVGGEEIETTVNHPFYVEGEGFTAAGDLMPGDLIRTADGQNYAVEAVETEQTEEPVPVYNLEVEDYHTYYVSELQVLVHNKCGKASKGLDSAIKDSKKTVDVNGKTVTMDNRLFDPNFVDKKGRTNVLRMEQGLAPIGKDGKSVNIHHINQTNEGPVIEILSTEHYQNYKKLHTNTGQKPSNISRKEFNAWRRNYWKWRSKNLY